MPDEALRSLIRDDAYRVERVLADGPSGRTELVTLGGEGPLVRKRMPLKIANPAVWAALVGVGEPLLPHVEEIYRTPDELVVVYAYVEGEPLRDLLAREGRLGKARAAAIVCDVCTAAAALHARGIVHRDITPGNVIVASDGAHLMDLGIARMRSETGTHDTTNLGTWGFAAPEQFGFAQTDARSDVFAIGRLLGCLLVGVQPDSDAFEEALGDRQLVSEHLAEVIRKATQFEPSARYQSVAEMRAELQAAEESRAERRASGEGLRQEGAPEGLRSQVSDERSARGFLREGPASRRLREVPLPALLGAVVVWGACGFYTLLVICAGALALLTGDPPWGVGEQVLGLDTIAFVLGVAGEAYRLVRRVGPYEGSERRMLLLLQHISIYLVIAFIIFLLELFVLVFVERAS